MIIILFSLFFFIINKINKIFIQIILQNLLFIYLIVIFIKFPLNRLILFIDLYYNLGLDYYSWGLILLSVWIIIIIIIVSGKIFLNFYIYYLYLIYLIIIFLLIRFYSINIIWFYIYFESSLIPIFLLILGWGYQINRIQAGLYIILYTLFGSLPLLLIIFYWYKINYSININIWYNIYLSGYFYFIIIFGFLIKIPIYFLHLWLPKAHVEAPVIGSMILAGVILKLGSYGLIRILLILRINYYYCKILIIFRVMGGILASLICLNQIDIKILVAYSSVVHISILMAGLLTIINYGYLGGYLIIISHGLCSSGIFFLVNINYERLLSRSLYINKGIINYLPSLRLMWFLLVSSNLSFPPSLNLFSEIFLVISIISWIENIWVILIFLIFIRALYSLYLYSFRQQGKFIKMRFFIRIKVIEFLVLFLHWIPLNIIFIIINIFFYFNSLI